MFKTQFRYPREAVNTPFLVTSADEIQAIYLVRCAIRSLQTIFHIPEFLRDKCIKLHLLMFQHEWFYYALFPKETYLYHNIKPERF